MVESVNQQYHEKYEVILPQDYFSPVIEDSIKVAWEMLTLLPPAVLCTPEKYFDEWHTAVTDFLEKKRYFTLKYYRPLMLSHAHGPPAVKAMVMKVASSEPTVNQESDSEDDGT